MFGVKYFDDPEIMDIELMEIGNKYPLILNSWILDSCSADSNMDEYVQRICIKPSSPLDVGDILWLKKGELSTHRIVRIRSFYGQKYILPFMDQFAQKYKVEHIEFNDGSLHWDILPSLRSGWICDNDCEFITAKDGTESKLEVSLFVANKRIAILKARANQRQEEHLDVIFAFIIKMLKIANTKPTRIWTNPQWTYISCVPDALTDYYQESNRSKTQRKYIMSREALKGVFGLGISEETITKHGAHYILSVIELELIWHKNKMANNLRIRGRVLKPKPPPPKSKEKEIQNQIIRRQDLSSPETRHKRVYLIINMTETLLAMLAIM
eukprot:425676_1